MEDSRPDSKPKNQNTIIYIGLALCVLVGCYFLFFYDDPNEEEIGITAPSNETVENSSVNNNTELNTTAVNATEAVNTTQNTTQNVTGAATNNTTTDNRTNMQQILEWRRNVTKNSGGSGGSSSSGGSSHHDDDDEDDSDTDNTNNTTTITAYTIDARVVDVAGKGASSNITNAGNIITYQIIVTNTGNVNLTSVSLSSATITAGNPLESLSSNSILDAGENWTYSATYVVTQLDMDTSGGGDNSIDSVVAVDCEQLDPRSTTVSTPMLVSASYSVTESYSGDISRPGDNITFIANVTNAGNVNLTGVIVSGSITSFNPVSNSANSDEILNPGETWNYSGTYTATVDDMIKYGNGSIENIATVDCDQLGAQTANANARVLYRYVQNTVTWGALTETLTDNISATDPTLNQLVTFMLADTTDMRDYDSNSFDSADFARTVHDNAEVAGIRGKWVGVTLENNVNRACTQFSTTDDGIKYVDCTSDENVTDNITSDNWDSTVVRMASGENYTRHALFADSDDIFPVYGKVNGYLS